MVTNKKVHLIVVAHPDDEVLSLGGAARSLALDAEVHTCLMAAHVQLRSHRPTDDELKDDMMRAHEIVGMKPSFFGGFPNIQMNTVPHIQLVQFIEEAILETRATHVYTHHPFDLNDDHRQVSNACQAAVRLFQRRQEVPRLEGFYYVEVLSSTDWAFSVDGAAFRPTGFFEIGEDGLQRKLDALHAYRHVMRPFPHSRSEEVVRGLAAVRGAQAGVKYAEAVQVVFQRFH